MSYMSATDLAGPAGGRSSRPSGFMGYVGGAVSLALIVAGVVWGVRVVMRDVSGIPVVRAAQMEMRVAPERPGGEVAENAGLAVNAVAAEGRVAPVADAIRLAPQDTALTDEDLAPLPVEEDDESAERQIAEEAPAPEAPEPDATTLALAEALGQPAVPVAAPAALIPASAPGVAHVLRPRARPASLSRPAPAAVAATLARNIASADAGFTVLEADALPSGTPLAQLGAFASPELAVQEWDRLSRVYSEYFGTRTRVIMRAETSGRTFYRLRVRGFADMDDTRRFCSAIKAGGRSDCIPVMTR